MKGLKFNRSKDGKERATVIVKFRLTRDAIERLTIGGHFKSVRDIKHVIVSYFNDAFEKRDDDETY